MREFHQNEPGSSERKAAKWVFPAVVIAVALAVGILAFLAGMRFADSRDGSGGRVTAKSEEGKNEENEAEGADAEETEAETEQTGGNAAETETATSESETQEAETWEIHEDFTGEDFYIAPVAGGYRCLDMSASEGNKMLMLAVEPQGYEQLIFYLMRYTLPVENGQIAEGTFSVEPIFSRSMAHYTGNGFYEFDDGNSHIYIRTSQSQDGNVSGYQQLEVYGFDSLYDPGQYENPVSYNGMTGNTFFLSDLIEPWGGLS